MKAKWIRSYLLAGLIVWLPIVVTYVVLRFIVDLMDHTLQLLPKSYQPEALLGVHLPGFGVLLSLILLLLTGLIARNFFGQRIVAWGEAILLKIPLVRSIYNTSKQIISTLIASDSKAFRKVVLVEYPREGIWSLGFQTGGFVPKVNGSSACEMITVFIPTTPNPTSGFIIMLPQQAALELEMSVEEALKYVISLGVMDSGALKNPNV